MVHTHREYRYARERVRDATAVYFEWLAQSGTCDYDRQQRLLDVAQFYRSLAEIMAAQKKLATTTDDNGYRKWRAFLVLAPKSLQPVIEAAPC